ncbi:MAG: hypothetical protein BEN19_03200 [Epulopiscium sp. Nuni2H_MBin003]|nr:MAG: hypothetical protein BEN19_03200 [Epulopiscium sp. Nuni2H_MBin003]
MKIKNIVPLIVALTLVTIPINAVYYTEAEYAEAETGMIFEDKGIVLENYPELGYLVYRNLSNQTVRLPYYTSDLSVEKEGIEEIEDRVGYLDELFPYFEYDPRDTTIDKIVPGDNIYVRTNAEGYVTYISAYNDYMLRYGKVNSWKTTDGVVGELVIEDEKGQIFIYEVPLTTPTSKLGRPVNIGTVQPGEWVKLLVSNKIMGSGIIEENVAEVVIDGNTRVVKDVYRGEILQLRSYDNTLRLAYAQPLEQAGWGKYTDILTLTADANSFTAYLDGTRTSFDYVSRYFTGSSANAFVAVESFMGKDSVAKMNIQDDFQKLISPTRVISAVSNEIRLLSGETLYYGEDTIVLKNDRLIEPYNILVGDTIQTVVTGDNKIAVAKIIEDVGQGSLQIYRGLIKKIDNRESFVVETFSMLQYDEWYYHPQPRTFSLDHTTQFYDDGGFVEDGIETFVAYGEASQLSEIVTIVAAGDKAVLISNMPYTREVVRGEVYSVEDQTAFLKDVFHYNVDDNLWSQYSTTNVGISATLNPNGFILKNGQVVTADKLEVGDKISVMLEEELLETIGGGADGVSDVPAYIMVVK